jgi:cytochrome P450
MSSKKTTDYVYDSIQLLANPVAVFDQIREDGDVVWCPALRRWLVLSKPAAIKALSNPDLVVYDLFNAFRKIEEKSKKNLQNILRICDWIPFLHDGARHNQLRLLFAKVLTELQDDYLYTFERVSSTLLEQMLCKGKGDFAVDYSDRLHIETLGRLAEFSEEDSLWIAENSSSQGSVDFAASLGEILDANHRATVLLDRIEMLIKKHHDSKLIKMIHRQLVSAGIEDNLINRTGFMTALMLLGRDTLSGTLTVGLAHLFGQNQGELKPENWSDESWWLNEYIRLSSTVQIVNRVATKEVFLAGQRISKGDMLMVFPPAANRDPSSFSCPHSISDTNSNNIAFGTGRHLCTGKVLSRKSINIVLKHLSMLQNIKAMQGQKIDDSKNTRKYKNLPITLQR